jgi:hypothetical protein
MAGSLRSIAAAAALMLTSTVGAGPCAGAQSAGPKEAAAKLSGNWKLNAALTPSASNPGRGRGIAREVSVSFANSAPQRGGRGGRGGAGGGAGTDASAPLTAAEVAAQNALAILHEVPIQLNIEASADAVTFRDPRGEWHFKIDGRNSTMEVPGGALRVKSKWDKSALRQEFSSAQRTLVKMWSIDANDRLVLTERFESITFKSESKAVFDRQ